MRHLAITVVAAAVATAPAAADVFASYTIDATGTTGTLDGVGFTVTRSGDSDPYPTTFDMNDDAWDWAGSQSTLEYEVSRGSNITISFESAVSDLKLYLIYFRSGGSTGGWDQYDFNHSFTTNANFSGETSGNSVTTTSGYTNGVLTFNGSITTLTISTDGNASWSGDQQFALAASDTPSAVPGVGVLAAIAGVGLAGRRRRR